MAILNNCYRIILKHRFLNWVLLQLILISGVSCSNGDSISKTQTSNDIPIVWITADPFYVNENDATMIPLTNEKMIKLFIYRKIITFFESPDTTIRLMQETDFSFFKKELQKCFSLKNIESGNRHIKTGLPKARGIISGEDHLDYSLSYMTKNKVYCIMIDTFSLDAKSETLDIGVGYFCNILDAGGKIYRFKREGNFWYFVGVKNVWIS